MTVKMVVFDLGGVLVRVARTWEQAAEHAGVSFRHSENAQRGLSEFPEFEEMQAERISWGEYEKALSEWLGLPSHEAAARVHDHILIEPYPETVTLVQELESAGVRTACLSNTNARHWPRLIDPGFFPAVSRLQLHVASHHLGLNKPFEPIYRALEDQSGLKPKDLLFFDDAAANVAAAIEFGWRAHLVDPLGDPASQIRAALRFEDSALNA